MFENSLRRIPQINNQNRLRLLLIVAPSIIVMALAFTLSSWPQPLYVLAALGAIVGAWVLINRPHLGILLLIICTSLFPFTISTGTKTALNLSVILVPGLLGLWVLKLLARKNQLRFHLDPPVKAALGLAAAAFLAFVLGQLPWYPLAPAPLTAQLGGLAIFVFSAGAFILTINHIQDSVWLERMVYAFIFVAGLQMVAIMMPNILPLRNFFHPMNSSMTITWIVVLSFSLALFHRKLHVSFRILLFLVVLLAFFLTFIRLRTWASGWMPALVGILTIIVVWRPQWGVILTVIGCVIGLIFLRNIIGIIVIEDNIYSVETRLEAWRLMVQIIKVNPFLGLGPANYYWYTPLLSIFGYDVEFNSHNQYVDLLAQTGVIGIAFFCWWAASLAKIGWRLRTKVEESFDRAFVFAAIGGLAATLASGLLGDWILPFVYNVGLAGFRGSVIAWIMLGSLVALEKIYDRNQNQEPQPKLSA